MTVNFLFLRNLFKITPKNITLALGFPLIENSAIPIPPTTWSFSFQPCGPHRDPVAHDVAYLHIMHKRPTYTTTLATYTKAVKNTTRQRKISNPKRGKQQQQNKKKFCVLHGAAPHTYALYSKCVLKRSWPQRETNKKRSHWPFEKDRNNEK